MTIEERLADVEHRLEELERSPLGVIITILNTHTARLDTIEKGVDGLAANMKTVLGLLAPEDES